MCARLWCSTLWCKRRVCQAAQCICKSMQLSVLAHLRRCHRSKLFRGHNGCVSTELCRALGQAAKLAELHRDKNTTLDPTKLLSYQFARLESETKGQQPSWLVQYLTCTCVVRCAGHLARPCVRAGRTAQRPRRRPGGWSSAWRPFASHWHRGQTRL